MGEVPVLSIVTICFNNQAQIEKTLLSVIAQKSPEVEYVVIDGGSTDGTLEILRAHQGSIDQLVSEPDAGIYDALNKGIRLSRGTLVGLIHGGDALRPKVLSTVMAYRATHPEAILYGGISTYRNGRFEALVGPSADHLPYGMIAHPGTFVPKKIYEEIGYYDTSYRIAGDYKLFLTFYQKKVPFVWMETLVADFDLSGASSQQQALALKEITRVKTELGILEPQTSLQRFFSKLRRVGSSVKDLFR